MSFASIHETMAGSLVILQGRKNPRPFPVPDIAILIGLLCRWHEVTQAELLACDQSAQ